MKARPASSLNVEIGGFVVKLVCRDPALYSRIKSTFHCLPAKALAQGGLPAILSSDLSDEAFSEDGCPKPIMTLTVYPAASTANDVISQSRGKRLTQRVRPTGYKEFQKVGRGVPAEPSACVGYNPPLTDPLRGGFVIPSGAVMDGEGEYVATFDPVARRAVIRLTGSPGAGATLALANFIRRIFARLVIDHNGAVFHSACVVRSGAAYIFFGKSGAGKSTVCQATLERSRLGEALRRSLVAQASGLSQGDTIACHALRVASDDLTLVRIMGGRLLAWGLPAFGLPARSASAKAGGAIGDQELPAFRPGYAGQAPPKRYAQARALRPGESPPYQLSRGVFPICAAFTLVKDRRNFVRRLKTTAAIAGMLAFSSDLSEPEPVGKTVDLLTRLVHTVPCYELHFSKDPVFWNAIDAELNKKETFMP